MTSKSELKRKATLDPVGTAERMWRLEGVAEVARKVNRQLNEWPLIRQHSYLHEDLHKAIGALDSAREGG